MSKIYYISKEDLAKKYTLYNFIYPNEELNYYISDDFSTEFYIALAKAGFISVYQEEDGLAYLLPEMQYSYAVLDFENLHISKKVAKLLKKDNYTFKVSNNIKGVINSIKAYHEDCWIEGLYEELLYNLLKEEHENFELMSFEVWQDDILVAGEIGYKIKNTYTSLSGFAIKEKKYNNYGKLQLTLTAKYLEANNYAFWNLGHPYMMYKTDLGAKVLFRKEFLYRWLREVEHA
jgi:Leu/Phe-tRNA-protein transferase